MKPAMGILNKASSTNQFRNVPRLPRQLTMIVKVAKGISYANILGKLRKESEPCVTHTRVVEEDLQRKVTFL